MIGCPLVLAIEILMENGSARVLFYEESDAI